MKVSVKISAAEPCTRHVPNPNVNSLQPWTDIFFDFHRGCIASDISALRLFGTIMRIPIMDLRTETERIAGAG